MKYEAFRCDVCLAVSTPNEDHAATVTIEYGDKWRYAALQPYTKQLCERCFDRVKSSLQYVAPKKPAFANAEYVRIEPGERDE